MWWAVALSAIMLLPVIALKLFVAYQLLRMRTAAPAETRSVLLAWSAVCLASVGINVVVLGSAVFVAVHPAPARSDVWRLFSLLILCVVSMSFAGWRQRRLRSRLGPEGEAFVQAVHVPDLPWKRATGRPSEIA
jgi:hypothetical protein